MPQNIKAGLDVTNQEVKHIGETDGRKEKSRSMTQVVVNILLYVLLAYLFIDSLIEKDYWYAFVVGFLIAVSIILTLLPKYHAKEVSPGDYPYED